MPLFYGLHEVSYGYVYQGRTLQVLKHVTFFLKPGEMVALMGPSGSGKSTLLHVAGLLDQPAEGDVILEDQSVCRLSDVERTRLRNRSLGFVYQFHHLLPDFTALENICIPQWLAGKSGPVTEAKARALLDKVDLAHRASHRPSELSGGEQQRVALARALANDPQVLIADEPTGNLDEATSQKVFSLLRTLARERRLAVLMATHNPALAEQMDRVLFLHDGTLIPQTLSPLEGMPRDSDAAHIF